MGRLRNIGRLRAGGSAGFNPSSITFTSGLWLDPSDITTGFQDSAGTTPQTASGQPTGKRLDKSGRGNHVLQATAGFRPEYDVISGLSSDFFDGSDDGYATNTFVAGSLTSTMDCFIAIKRSTSAAGVLGFVSVGGNCFGNYNVAGNSTSGVGTPSQFVDGAALPGGLATQLNTALTVGAWHIYEAQGLDLSAWTVFGTGNYSGEPIAADIGGIILVQAQSTANRNSLRRWLGSKVGLSL